VGFAVASGDGVNWVQLAVTLFGTALVAGASQTLNQVIETDVDRLMERTKDRPLPAGRIKPQNALLLGVGMALTGILVLGFCVNLVTAGLSIATLFVYLALYTPLKRYSPLCISVGASPALFRPFSAGLPSVPISNWHVDSLRRSFPLADASFSRHRLDV